MTTAPLQILLLDDDRMIREIFRKEIGNALPPSIIHEAASYEEAITTLSKEVIDFAYLDFKLIGEKTGLDVLHYINANELPTRAFILSQGTSSDGYLDSEQMSQCMAAGAVGYLSKKVDSIDILREVYDGVNQGFRYFPKDCTKSNGNGSKKLEPKKTLADFGIRGRLCEVLQYICEPTSYKKIAEKMGINEKTVRQDYAQDLFRKLDVENKEQLIVKALQLGIVPKSGTDSD